MKKDEIKVGATYSAKISDKVVPVRITEEKWTGDKHTGWIGLNTKTNRPVRIKSAAKLRSEITSDHSEQSEPEAPAEKPDGEMPAKKGRGAKAPQEPKPKRLSGLDAAAEVLKKADKPMNFKDITEAALALGWKTSGQTPAATLYAACIREIAAKGKESRFHKTDWGLFEHSGVEAE